MKLMLLLEVGPKSSIFCPSGRRMARVNWWKPVERRGMSTSLSPGADGGSILPPNRLRKNPNGDLMKCGRLGTGALARPILTLSFYFFSAAAAALATGVLTATLLKGFAAPAGCAARAASALGSFL